MLDSKVERTSLEIHQSPNSMKKYVQSSIKRKGSSVGISVEFFTTNARGQWIQVTCNLTINDNELFEAESSAIENMRETIELLGI